MRIYSDYPWHRIRQIAADIFAVFALWTIVRIAGWLGDGVNELKGFGERMESAGADLGGRLADAGNALRDVPFVGEEISAPFDAAAAGAFELERAGVDQQVAVGELAITVAVASAVLPVVAVVLLWLVPRVRFMIRATRAGRLAQRKDALDLLALRALLTADPATILKLVPDAADAWREGDKGAIRRLAALELKGSGVALRHGRKKLALDAA